MFPKTFLKSATTAILTVSLVGMAYAQEEKEKPQNADQLMFQNHPLNETIWNLKTGKPISEEELWSEVLSSDYVLLGERHDNPRHHEIQAQAIKQIGKAGKAPTVVFEMVPPQYAGELQDVNPEAVSQLGKKIDWEKRGWPAWPIYQPVFEAAVTSNMPLATGDPGKKQLFEIAKGKKLDESQIKQLQWERQFEEAEKDDLLDELVKSHCNMMPREAMAPLVSVQRLKDATMAAQMREAKQNGQGAVLIAGTGHTRKDRGVPWWLNQNSTSVSIAPIEVFEGKNSLSDYQMADKNLYDYAWFTGRVDLVDPCEKYADQLKAMKKKHGG